MSADQDSQAVTDAFHRATYREECEEIREALKDDYLTTADRGALHARLRQLTITELKRQGVADPEAPIFNGTNIRTLES